MPVEQQLFVPAVRRGIRLQLIGLGLSLALVILVAPPAREHRSQAALLLLLGIGFVLDARLLRTNGALLETVQVQPPSWIPRVSGLAFALGVALILCALAFLWQPRAAP